MLRDDFDDGLPPRPNPSPWTASRCNRSIRKLTNFVAKIEKWHQKFLIALETQVEEDQVEESQHQPSWLAQDTTRKRQQPRKTYTLRRKTIPQTPAPRGPRKSRSAGVTPRNDSHLRPIADIRYDSESFIVRETSKIAPLGNATRAPLLSHSWTAATAHLADDYEDILRDGWAIIPAFLAATSDPDRPSSFDSCSKHSPVKPGAKSLMEMCLARLSRDIVQQQKENNTDSAGHGGQHDIIYSQLNELEDYFGDSRNGWPPLRNFVRICGISMVTQLIRNGILPEEAAMDLGTRWQNRPFLQDFSDAVQDALVDSSIRPAASDDDNPYLPGIEELEVGNGQLQQSWKGRLAHRRTLHALRTREDPTALLASGIRYNHLTLSVLLSKTNKGWENYGIELLGAVYQAALACGQNYTCEDLRRMPRSASFAAHGQGQLTTHPVLDERMSQRLKMTLYLALFHAQDSSVALPKLITSLSKHAQIVVGLGYDRYLSALQQTLTAQILLVHLCHLLSKDSSIPRGLLRSFESLLGSVECRNSLSGQLAGTVIACFDDDLEGLQRLVEKILSIDCHECELLHTLLVQIISDGAMEYAVKCSRAPETLSWATEIHEKTRERLESLDASGREFSTIKLKSEYRWDDGIEEWIEKTPAGNKTSVYLPRPDSGASQLNIPGTVPMQRPGLPDCLSPTAARCRKNRSAIQRKRLACDFEIHVDGDFEYKKPRRRKLAEQGCWSRCAGTATLDEGNQKAEDISGDELSL